MTEEILAERLLAAFDEFLETDLWKVSYQNFQKNGFKLHLVKEVAGKRIEKEFKLPFGLGKMLRPEIIDRAILEVKDMIYSYAEKNPEKAADFIRLLIAKLNSVLEPQNV